MGAGRGRPPVPPRSAGGATRGVIRSAADMQPWYGGIDLGGTQLRVGAVGEDGALVGEILAAPTGPHFDPGALGRALGDLLARVAAVQGGAPGAVGMGVAGVVDGGPLTGVENLPLLDGMDLAGMVAGAAGVPTALENDARCFTLAEARWGAARGARDVCGITIGTGVGCGIILDGRFCRGAGAQAGEVWRIPWRGGTVNDALSGAGVVRAFLAAGGAPGEATDAAAVAERARSGDPAAREAWRTLGQALGFLCQCVMDIVSPEVIVLGGSMSASLDLFRDTLAPSFQARPTRFTAARLGLAAGIIGAATLHL